MTSVGDILRSARESQGREMHDIAQELCITQRYLRALERDDLSNLPGTFFYKSFVKQYSAILGIPWKQIEPGVDALTRIEEPPLALPGNEKQGQANPSREPAPIRVLDPIVEASNHYFANRRIGVPLAALVAVLLACSGFYSWWNRPPAPQQNQQASRTSSVAGPAGLTAEQIADSPDHDNVSHVVLKLSATERTWLSITNSEGKQIFSGMLEPSQTKTLTAADAAQMKVGNAGGIDVRMNGKDIGPIGERGEVKVVRFTAPDKVQIVEPKTTPPPDGAL